MNEPIETPQQEHSALGQEHRHPGRVALVTGGSRGIGRSIALILAQSGYQVVINFSNGLEAACKTLEEIQSFSPNSQLYQADVSSPEAVQAMADWIKKKFGRLDVLVNNSGITRDGLLLQMKEQDFDRLMQVNLKGAFLCTQAVLPLMLRQKRGSIINMSSVVGLHGNAGQCSYAASKAGLAGFTKSLAREVARRGIRVNAIAPGFIQTEMTAALHKDLQKKMLDQIPLKRMGTSEDVAQAALFLAEDASSYITGQILQIDGGLFI